MSALRQLSIFDEKPPADPRLKPTIGERFDAFHEKNPEVYRLFRDLAIQLRDSGISSYGAKAIFEVIRFHRTIQTKGEPFKLNNIFTSRYARLLIDEEPGFESFFQTRELKAQ